MKMIKLLLVIMAVAVMALALGSDALAFHEDGVAYCAGCHSMHFSENGAPPPDGVAGDSLLKYGSATATCLECHASYGQFAGGEGYGGGGDFYWITKTWSWTAHNSARSSPGDNHGHNVIATDLGLNQDQTLTEAPGGTFNSAELSCASCHDPHGHGESALLLRTLETYKGVNFPAAPVMQSPGRRTASSNAVSDTNHPAYGSGMSAWCAACHTTFDDGLVNHMHPTDQQLGTTISGNYNRYVSTADPTGGLKDGAYWEFVPFELNRVPVEADMTSTVGADPGSKVACITCHRAHATAFDDAVRWDTHVELLEESHPNGGIGSEADNSTLADQTNSYYGQTALQRWGPEQRSLCNKCHAQDS
jgi:hypothetical protein